MLRVDAARCFAALHGALATLAAGAQRSASPAPGLRAPEPGPSPAPPGDVVVSAVGMVSPVGADAAQTFSSVRAGLRRMRELPEVYACLPEDPRFDEPRPLVGSAIYHLDVAARREGRVAEWLGFLAAQAFRDLVRRARLAAGDLAGLGLFLALPGAALGPESRQEITVHFHNFAEQDLLPHVELAFGDRDAALSLAEKAAALLRERRLARAAVGGADSYLFPARLASLDRDWRLLSERNPDGFQPGEAAAFFLLEARGEAQRRGIPPLAALRGFAGGRFEAGPGPPGAGAELASVLERLLPAEGAPPLVVCDLNGESVRTREWGHALSRLGRRLGVGPALEHPASALGDVGAATGASLVALAAQYLGSKHAGRAAALVFAGSDAGERRALLLARP